jgi:hypothetical protein
LTFLFNEQTSLFDNPLKYCKLTCFVLAIIADHEMPIIVPIKNAPNNLTWLLQLKNIFHVQSEIINIENRIIVVTFSFAKPYKPIIYKRYPNVYVKIVILKGNFENGSPFVSVNELHIVGEASPVLINTSDLPTITETKQAIKRPAKYIIPLRS